jgi:ACT domain-containing protein
MNVIQSHHQAIIVGMVVAAFLMQVIALVFTAVRILIAVKHLGAVTVEVRQKCNRIRSNVLQINQNIVAVARLASEVAADISSKHPRADELRQEQR